MRLLIVTQAIDPKDPILGFFHRWLTHLAPQFEHIEVICLVEGVHTTPKNVRVHSLGKEKGVRNRLVYAIRFLQHLWRLRGSYDAVLVHMNQEYVLLAGWWWVLSRVPIHFWRNHYAGGHFTDIAAFFCTKIYCTSRASYTAKYGKTVLMPVGVDTDFFQKSRPDIPGSILSLGRIAPSKRIEVLIDALRLLRKRDVSFSCSIYGDALPHDAAYLRDLQDSAATHDIPVTFHGGVSNDATPPIYSAHAMFVNLSESGMYDKTILEAAACGTMVLAASEDFAREAGESTLFTDARSLAEKLEIFLTDKTLRLATIEAQRSIVKEHSLKVLITRLVREIT